MKATHENAWASSKQITLLYSGLDQLLRSRRYQPRLLPGRQHLSVKSPAQHRLPSSRQRLVMPKGRLVTFLETVAIQQRMMSCRGAQLEMQRIWLERVLSLEGMVRSGRSSGRGHCCRQQPSASGPKDHPVCPFTPGYFMENFFVTLQSMRQPGHVKEAWHAQEGASG